MAKTSYRLDGIRLSIRPKPVLSPYGRSLRFFGISLINTFVCSCTAQMFIAEEAPPKSINEMISFNFIGQRY